MMTHENYPIEECVAKVAPLIKRGATAHQKFTCSTCGSRQTIEEPNKFFTSGKCEECGNVTDIREVGCNYVLAGPADVIMRHMEGRDG